MDINIDALYNILKKNQGDVNDAMGSKKKTVVVTSDPLALIADKTIELKKITALLAKAFNRRKFYSKPTNNNLRTSSTSQSANKKQEFVKTDNKRVEKKDDEKKRDMSKVKCYNCKKEGYFTKDCKKADVKDYEYYKTKMLLAKKDKNEQVLLAEDQAWMESSKASSSSADEKISEVSYYLSESESESEFETSKYYDNFTNYGLFVNNDDDQEIFYDAIASGSENFIENHIDSQKDYDKSDEKYAKLEAGRYEYMIRYSAYFDNDKQHRKQIADQQIVQIYLWIIDSGCSKHMMGKIHRKHHKSKTAFASNKPLYLLHMDLYGLMRIQSINGKRYVLVVVDDYSRYTWVFFLHSKDEASEVIISFIKKTQVNLQLQVQRVRTDNGTEFKNKTLAKFFDEDVGKLKAKGDIRVFVRYLKEYAAFRIYNKQNRESSSSSLNDDVQQSPKEVILPSSNTQSILINMVPNGDEASTSHNVFNERLEDAYFDASTSFHDLSNV
nr:retrotransposon protein Ty1-copia subclass [Tanacetum cinerariifolium]